MTWYPESFTKVPMNDMNMRADPSRNYPGRTYRFYTGVKVFGFGYGLSYTSFTYKLSSAPLKLSLPESIKPSPERKLLSKGGNEFGYIFVDEVTYCSFLRFEVKISVTNAGDLSGSEVVLLFSKPGKSFRGSPETQLIGFERVHLSPYESGETRFVVDPCEQLSFADENGDRILLTGDHVLLSESVEHVVSLEI